LTADSVPPRDMPSATILAVGVLLAGLFVGTGFARGRSADRYVTVKGVAEQDVQADLAIWPIRIVAADNDLAAAQAHLQASIRTRSRGSAKPRRSTRSYGSSRPLNTS